MPVDRRFWRRHWFTHERTHPWPCPTCHYGNLSLVKGSLFEKESIESLRNHQDNDWDPMNSHGVFCCLLQCSSDTCKDHVAVSGLSEAGEEGEYGHMVICFRPLMFTPALHLIRIPKECPENVAAELLEAFKLFWSDPAGGMNHIRKAVELIMDHLKIPTKKKSKAGKYSPLPLHRRIEEFRKKNPVLADRLMAIKWLGNIGSHTSEVSKNAFFDACDLLEDFIQTHFEKHGRKIIALTKKVNKRKGKSDS